MLMPCYMKTVCACVCVLAPLCMKFGHLINPPIRTYTFMTGGLNYLSILIVLVTQNIVNFQYF